MKTQTITNKIDIKMFFVSFSLNKNINKNKNKGTVNTKNPRKKVNNITENITTIKFLSKIKYLLILYKFKYFFLIK